MYRIRSEWRPVLWIGLVGVSCAIAGCSQQASTAHPPPTSQRAEQDQGSPYRPTASIQELMDAVVDPSADALWDSVGFISTLAGTEARQPHTDEEWKAVRRSAITLIEATNLLSMPGRRVAPAGARPVDAGDPTPEQIQQHIDATHASFVQFAHALRESALQALVAIDAKDPNALMTAGGTIDEACEACHVTYWYPNQKVPGT